MTESDFPAARKKTQDHRLFGVGLFFIMCALMMNPFQSRSFLVFLVACLVLTGLAVSPSVSLAALPAPENSELETDQGEFEDEFLTRNRLTVSLLELADSKTWLGILKYRNLHLTPASPPPKDR